MVIYVLSFIFLISLVRDLSIIDFSENQLLISVIYSINNFPVFIFNEFYCYFYTFLFWLTFDIIFFS